MATLVVKSAEDDRRVVATKTKGIAQRHIYFPGLRLVEREVQFRVKAFVVGKMVDGGRYHVVLNGHNRGYGFNGTGSSKQVARHGFGRTNVQFISVLAENGFNGFGFAYITERRGSAVHVNVIYFFRFD